MPVPTDNDAGVNLLLFDFPCRLLRFPINARPIAVRRNLCRHKAPRLQCSRIYDAGHPTDG